MTLEKAWFILEHGSSEGLPVFLEAIDVIKENYINVIRCKDCRSWYFADNRIPSEQENVCGRNGIVVTPDWFCADGERKEGR